MASLDSSLRGLDPLVLGLDEICTTASFELLERSLDITLHELKQLLV